MSHGTSGVKVEQRADEQQVWCHEQESGHGESEVSLQSRTVLTGVHECLEPVGWLGARHAREDDRLSATQLSRLETLPKAHLAGNRPSQFGPAVWVPLANNGAFPHPYLTAAGMSRCFGRPRITWKAPIGSWPRVARSEKPALAVLWPAVF